jgi:NAD(P)-dependent dehydrogenase (short-subunit alcohol dehydrogenase family)
LRAELAPHGIGVSALCPAAVRTALIEADRNRPDALARSGGTAEVMRDAIEGGLDPDEVGDCVVAGIQRDAAYIFTHPGYRAFFEERFDAVLAAFDA